MEPELLTISRESRSSVTKERHPGDGEEAGFTYKTSIMPYNSASKKCRIPKRLQKTSNSASIVSQTPQADDMSFSLTESSISQFLTERSNDFEHLREDLFITIDSLKTKLKLCEEHNSQLIEEKMRLSQQLGLQTQVNNEVKRLLVASIGEDLQEKYERMIQDKAQIDLELTHLRNIMEDDREEVEQAMIQADVWRSKFLASRVMNDELARWKSALYYKYRESHAALQSLLEEHSKIRALNNSTRRGLVSLAEVLNCKDPSLDPKTMLTTIDVAFMNNDLIDALVEVTIETIEKQSENKTVREMIEIKDAVRQTQKALKNNIHKEFSVEANELTPAEQLAQEVVLNTAIQSDELTRMRHDYLAHNRISHFLSTNYHVTFNCCDKCQGNVHIV